MPQGNGFILVDENIYPVSFFFESYIVSSQASALHFTSTSILDPPILHLLLLTHPYHHHHHIQNEQNNPRIQTPKNGGTLSEISAR